MNLVAHDLGGRGRAVVLAHATGFCGLALAPLGRALLEAAPLRVWALDLPGHGSSPLPPDGDLSWSVMAREVSRTLDELGVEGAVGVGHSMGAAVLLDAEARRPGTFSRLWCFEAIVGPAPPPPAITEALVEGALRRHRTFSSPDAARSHYRARPPLSELAAAALDGYLAGGLVHRPDGSVALRCLPETEAACYRAGAAHDGWSRLGAVRCPTGVIRGERSRTVGKGLLEAQAAALPRGESQVITGVGHLGPMEDPGAVADAVLTAGDRTTGPPCGPEGEVAGRPDCG